MHKLACKIQSVHKYNQKFITKIDLPWVNHSHAEVQMHTDSPFIDYTPMFNFKFKMFDRYKECLCVSDSGYTFQIAALLNINPFPKLASIKLCGLYKLYYLKTIEHVSWIKEKPLIPRQDEHHSLDSQSESNIVMKDYFIEMHLTWQGAKAFAGTESTFH